MRSLYASFIIIINLNTGKKTYIKHAEKNVFYIFSNLTHESY